jgi:hypothetical protein
VLNDQRKCPLPEERESFLDKLGEKLAFWHPLAKGTSGGEWAWN